MNNCIVLQFNFLIKYYGHCVLGTIISALIFHPNLHLDGSLHNFTVSSGSVVI